jgi:NifU-like protein involved in Fe-S cluster formation
VTGYSPLVVELFTALPGSGPLPEGPGERWVGEAGDLQAGAWVRFEARVSAGRVLAAQFAAWGCPHTVAAAAWVAGRLPGCELTEVAELAAPRELVRVLEAPAAKLGRLLKVEDAARALSQARAAVGNR